MTRLNSIASRVAVAAALATAVAACGDALPSASSDSTPVASSQRPAESTPAAELDDPADDADSGEADDAGEAEQGSPSTSTTAPVESTTVPAPTDPPTSEPAPVDPCDTVSTDLGGDVSVVEGRCESGWAYVDTADLGDSQFIARQVGGTWAPVVFFPTPFLCADDLFSVGAPAAVVDRVNWACVQVAGSSVAYVDETFEGDLAIGDRGFRVRALQVQLARIGFGSVADADEFFGPGTRTRVARFQMSVGLVGSGRADDDTRRALGVFEGPRPLAAGSVVLDGSGIDGARLGDAEVTAETTLNALLGPPDFDTGYDPDFFSGLPCFPTPFRSVRWGGVSAEFGDRGSGVELLHIGVNRNSEGFVTPEGVAVTSSVDDVIAAGGSAAFEDVFQSTFFDLPSGVNGSIDDTTGTIFSMNAGFFPCGE